MNKTYNVATGIPAELLDMVRTWSLNLVWSNHAKREAVTDKYGTLPPASYPRELRPGVGNWRVVEVSTGANGSPQKIVIRRQADLTRSLVLVILRDGPFTGLVKTCWTNLNTDNHSTLDKSKFATA